MSMALQYNIKHIVLEQNKNLSVVDKKIVEYYNEMTDIIIGILRENNTKDIDSG